MIRIRFSPLLRRPIDPRLATLALVVVVALAIALPAAAQQEGLSGIGPGFHGALLGGSAGSLGSGHMFGGVHASWSEGRWGGALQAHLGSGNEFSSRFASGGPTVRFGLHPRADLELMVGAAWYSETLDSTGRAGSVLGPAGSVLVRIPTGPVHLVVGAIGWSAEYTDELAVNPVPAGSVRFVLGVGR